jgi:Uma2 family endonuclease
MDPIPELPTSVLGLNWNGARMTPEEFDSVDEYDELYCYQLIRGVVSVEEYPDAPEADQNQELGYLLHLYRKGRAHAVSLDATLPRQYVRTATSRILVDRAIWAGLGRLPNPRRDGPSIVVDFVSASMRDHRDYIEKRREYMEINIPEYWIIDRFQRTMTVVSYHPDGPGERTVHENEIYTTPLLPGFKLPLARLLAVADEWSQGETD